MILGMATTVNGFISVEDEVASARQITTVCPPSSLTETTTGLPPGPSDGPPTTANRLLG